MTRIIVVLILSLLVVGPSHGLASLTDEVNALVKKVDAHYLETQDLEAEFSQETQIEGFDSRLSSSGRVIIKKPGLLRWDYRQPNEEQILVEGDQVMWYVPQHHQVVKGNLTDGGLKSSPDITARSGKAWRAIYGGSRFREKTGRWRSPHCGADAESRGSGDFDRHANRADDPSEVLPDSSDHVV